jgi:hypothetical protein
VWQEINCVVFIPCHLLVLSFHRTKCYYCSIDPTTLIGLQIFPRKYYHSQKLCCLLCVFRFLRCFRFCSSECSFCSRKDHPSSTMRWFSGGCSSKCIDTAHDGGVHQYDDCSKRCFRQCVDNLPVDNDPTASSDPQEKKLLSNDLVQRLPGPAPQPPENQRMVLEGWSFLEQNEHSDEQNRKHLRNRKTQSKQQSFWEW